MGGLISADDPKWIELFSGLSGVQFARLVATYWRTNLTLRQVAPLFGISKSQLTASSITSCPV